ncbi:hypothetical protein [Acinetobacter sp. YH16057]|uniref:hypothetical protein n=1 Tax=Acinetobacter sp. YH16057 TaxID=2601195 RepID=UPI0015D2BB4B|nr:hypothetical protein [Acinetobacter sp. YH16057]
MKKALYNDVKNIIESKSITELSSIELSIILEKLYSNIDNQHLNNLVNKSLGEIIPFYSEDLKKPYWLHNDFDDDIWILNLNHKNEKTIDFTLVTLDDELPLTSNRKLITTLKTWIILSLSPQFNNGYFLTKSTITARINIVINLINYLFLNKHTLKLSKQNLSGINENFIVEALITFAKNGLQDGLYNYASRVKEYLISEIESINLEEIIAFEKKYPLISDNYIHKELGLDLDQIRKAKCFLFKKGAYVKESKDLYSNVKSNFFNFLFDGCLINPNHFRNTIYPELNISSSPSLQEYPYLPVKEEDNDSSTERYIMYYYRYIKVLSFLKNFEDCYHVKNIDFNKITRKRLQNLVELRDTAHFRTPPTIVVFPLLKNCFEFVFKYMDDILDSTYEILKYCNENNIKFSNIDNELIKKFCSKKLINIGVIKWYVFSNETQKFNKIRNNEGLLNLYDVLIGSLQIIIGAIMARRHSEILELNPTTTLFPNIDPYAFLNHEFYISFHNRKSGISGEYDYKELLTKPTPKSIAKIIFKLQNFNKKITNEKLCSINNIRLLNNISSTNLKISPLVSSSARKLIDCTCDYFQTPLVNYTSNIFCRYYIRQHQLRRFFTMLFFWSKSYAGLDSLRSFLGHTDIEHLYHYITEESHGEVLNGVKAKFLYHEISIKDSHDIENIDLLRDKILKHFNISQLDLFSEDDCLSFFPDTQECKDLKKIIPIQAYIESMLETHKIELYPDFFSTYNHDNEKIRDFRLIIKINED